MTLLSNDLAVSVTAGAAGNCGKAGSGLLGETPFQKLIAKALENDSLTSGTQSATQTDASEDTTGTASQDHQSVGDLVAALLFGNAGQAKLKIQTTGEDSTNETVIGAMSQDDADDDQTADSLASLLAMFDGTFRANLITSDDSAAATKTELTAADLAALLESAQPGKNGISGLLNRRAQLADLVENNGQSDKTDPVKLLSQTTDENGKVTVLAEIGGKQIELTGYLRSTDTESATTSTVAETSDETAVTGTTSTSTSSAGQGITLQELTALLRHTGEKASAPGLGQLGLEQVKMRPGQQGTGVEHHGNDKMETDPAEIVVTTDTVEATDEMKESTTLSGSSDRGSDSTDESLTTAAYQTQLNAAATTDPSSATQTSKQTGSTEAYSQVSDQILTTLEKKGPTEFKMQLQPENLGQIDISLKISEGKLIIDIAADRSQTQALLTGQIDKLISSLGLQNVQVESVQVTQQMNSDSQNSQNQSYQQNSGMNFSNSRQNSDKAEQSWQQYTGGIFGSQSDPAADEILEASNLTGNNFGRMNYKI